MQKITFHSFRLGDVEDAEVYAAQPIYEWMQTDAGKWVNERCEDLTWLTQPDHEYWGHRVIIRGSLTDYEATEYYLKFSK